jgi:hypothetical protein
MQASLGHHVRVGARVGAREKLRVVGWLQERAERQDHRRRQWRMAAGGGVAWAREAKRQGGFIGPVARRGGFGSPSWPTRAPAWERRRWRCAAHRRPMADGGSPDGECA